MADPTFSTFGERAIKLTYPVVFGEAKKQLDTHSLTFKGEREPASLGANGSVFPQGQVAPCHTPLLPP